MRPLLLQPRRPELLSRGSRAVCGTGIDQGGLLKELLELLIEDGLDGRRGLFARTAAGEAYPAPAALRTSERGAASLEFLGAAVGKALYEGMLLNVELAPLFVMALQRRQATVEDLTTLDPELYRSLMQARGCAKSAWIV
jgi:ubiquitin-protein ligase E3 B